MNKTQILFLFGGHPFEHRASIISASNIFPIFDNKQYDVNLLYISPTNEWSLCETTSFISGSDDADAVLSSLKGCPAHLKLGVRGGSRLIETDTGRTIPVDLVFSAMTGKMACDGVMQGLWQAAGWPMVGPGILGAAIGFDKDVMKRLLKEAGLPTCSYRLFYLHDWGQIDFWALKAELGLPFFVKPANSGSSLGAHIIRNKDDFYTSIKDAFLYDAKLIVEPYIAGSELEIYCIGVGQKIYTTVIRETVAPEGFWSYEAKYVTDNVEKYVPARITDHTATQVKAIAQSAYQVLEGRGLARIDFFLTSEGTLYVNEINTAPVFMSHANQPPLWELSGIGYPKLLEWILQAS